jgi:Zinc finger, C3HC4 type (RING finger)
MSKDSTGNKCLVCYDNEPNIVFDPCQHGGICQICLEDLLAKSQTTCHLCRKVFSHFH